MIKVGIVATLAEVACVVLVHSSHRAAVAVVSGQAVAGGLAGNASPLLGWLVVAAQMASVLVLPPVILGCILHVVANRPFQRRRAVR